jgi:hypothetical protein
MYLQKEISKKLLEKNSFFVALLKIRVLTKIAGYRY